MRPGPPGPVDDPRGLRLVPGFVAPAERQAALDWLRGVHPLWEQRFSTVRPLPPREEQRPLLRPVYWLGNWQFACLGYYHPPRGTAERCVAAEPFPAPLQAWVARAEALVRRSFPPAHVPAGWRLNTCLVNLYGDRLLPGGRPEDRARVGAHRDFEPGPVASVSLGARALIQFTTPRGEVVRQQWLEDRSLQLFAGPTWKDRLFHRVQRVDRKGPPVDVPLAGFHTRRVNFTFRCVPEADVLPLRDLGPQARADVWGYVQELARTSTFWAEALAAAADPASGQGQHEHR
ncbi:alpha-ketoglutarate-dependent dioxygenase AlkB [Myxococcota bacterium]|nr:alpha-ketoglutarate-dependent dioxygenase AlkB [Myxococcota bacterium]